MTLNDLPRFPFLAGVAVSFLLLAVGCGGGSGAPVYSSSSIYPEERDGRPVLVYEILIGDGNGNPYSEGLLVTGTTFTPDSVNTYSMPIQLGQVQIVLEASTAGNYTVTIDTLTDTKGRVYQPLPDNVDLNGKVLLNQRYDP